MRKRGAGFPRTPECRQDHAAAHRVLSRCRGFRRREGYAPRLPRDCLGRLEKFEPTVGAFVYHDIAAARATADLSTGRWRSGRPLSPIDGMPVAIKDIIETTDMPTKQGSPLFVGWRTGRDAATVAACARPASLFSARP
jgi:Asp-tRNA(Asn)/Glu-tRNA(Gln) amidotransferase A subunit family amidase